MALDVASDDKGEVEELAAVVEALDETEVVLEAPADEVAAALDEEDDVEEAAAELDEEDELVEVVDVVLEVEEDVVLELVETAPAGLYLYTLSLSEPPHVSAGLPPQGITQPPSGEGTLPASSTSPQ